MPYLITAYDHPNMEAEREEVRQAHRNYLASFGKRLLASGALLDASGTPLSEALPFSTLTTAKKPCDLKPKTLMPRPESAPK